MTHRWPYGPCFISKVHCSPKGVKSNNKSYFSSAEKKVEAEAKMADEADGEDEVESDMVSCNFAH